MIADLIVLASVALTLAFVAVWALRPGVRASIERPKFEFQDALREFDRGQNAAPAPIVAGDARRD